MAARRLLTLVALLACLSAGCSDAESESAADATSPTSPSESSKESPDPTEPVDAERDPPAMPGGASKDTLKGAEAFVRHYIDLLNYATATGKINALHRAAHGCKSCRNYEQLYKRTYTRGGYMRYSGWDPTDVQAFDQQGVYVVLVTIHSPKIRYRLTQDSQPKVGPSSTYKLRFEAKHRGGRWVVTDLGKQEVPDNL